MSSRTVQHYFFSLETTISRIEIINKLYHYKKINASKADYGDEMDRTFFQRE